VKPLVGDQQSAVGPSRDVYGVAEYDLAVGIVISDLE